jgi:uncharacterized protein YeaO (DUF488 family)
MIMGSLLTDTPATGVSRGDGPMINARGSEEAGVGTIRIARVYDAQAETAGRRFLVERLWPRGVRRADLHLDGWPKDVAPSTGLRRWFGHDPERWPEFRRRYLAELEASPETVQPLLDAARAGDVTLLYSARDREHNSAVVLHEHLRDRLSKLFREQG